MSDPGAVSSETTSPTGEPWEAYGVIANGLAGWTFGQSKRLPTEPPAEQDRRFTVHSPVSFTVDGGTLMVAGPSAWRDCVRLIDSRLVVALPFRVRPGDQVLVLPQERGFPPLVVAKVSRCSPDTGELSAVWELEGPVTFTIEQGAPIAQVMVLAGGLLPETLTSDGPTLRIWRLHPEGCYVCPAERTLRGDASSAAMRWCGPFAHANAYGFWVFPPLDLDVIWHGGRSFDFRYESVYTDEDAAVVSRLQRSGDRYRYVPRKKVDFGTTLESVVSIWTGCIFQTPPGWGLLLRSPVNINPSAIFRAQEGILESDWLAADVWLNLQFVQQDKWAHIRRSDRWPPIAQLVPVPRVAYDQPWGLLDQPFERASEAGRDLYDRWNEYNYKKWTQQGQKDPSTYYRERRASGRGAERTRSTKQADGADS